MKCFAYIRRIVFSKTILVLFEGEIKQIRKEEKREKKA
jgi:hypothetical protein